MLGELNEMQIENLLTSQAIGRIGYSDGKELYILPVTYYYNGKTIVGQGREGYKVEAMREHPTVAFQVDRIFNMNNWESVLVHGTFHELHGKEAEKVRTTLFEAVLPLATSAAVHAHEHGATASIDDSNRVKPVIYEIKIKSLTGRFEKQ